MNTNLTLHPPPLRGVSSPTDGSSLSSLISFKNSRSELIQGLKALRPVHSRF